MKTQKRQPICPPAPVLTIKQKLTANILMTMAGNFDRRQLDANLGMADEMMACAKLTAEGIAAKLADALAQNTEIDEERWSRLVKAATRNAFIQVTDEGPLVQIGKNPSFASAVASSTALTVAPAGSAWARALTARREDQLRNHLKALGFPAKDIERVIAQWREEENKSFKPRPKRA
jgi:hypothetical protein